MSSFATPYPAELLQVARKAVWYNAREAEFRRVLAETPPGVFTRESWTLWHRRYGLAVPPLPRRRFPDGSFVPGSGKFFWTVNHESRNHWHGCDLAQTCGSLQKHRVRADRLHGYLRSGRPQVRRSAWLRIRRNV